MGKGQGMQNRLMQLMMANRGKGFARVDAAKADTGEATVWLYDYIVATAQEAEWFGGVAAETLVKEIAGITAGTINLRINSPGGDVFGGRAIELALRQHPANVIVQVDGVAASAASVVAMAGDTIKIPAGSMIMIHRAWTMALGNTNDMIKTAALLAKIDDTLAATYAARTGANAAAMLALMDAESWLTGEEAVAQKFADELTGAAAKAANDGAVKAWDLAALVGAQATAQAAQQKQAEPDLAAAKMKKEKASFERARILARLGRITSSV
jgi:ATP-dependent Clp protease, protease subunit